MSQRDELRTEIEHLALKIGDLDRTVYDRKTELLALEEKRAQVQDDITRLRCAGQAIDDLRTEFRKTMRLDIGIGYQPTGRPLSEPPRSKSANIQRFLFSRRRGTFLEKLRTGTATTIFSAPRYFSREIKDRYSDHYFVCTVVLF